MTWTGRVIGIGLSVLITASIFLAALYGPLYLMPHLRQIPPHRVPGLLNGAICIFFAWCAIRTYSTGSIKRRYLAPIERRDHPLKFWVSMSLDVLLSATFGYFALRSFLN